MGCNCGCTPDQQSEMTQTSDAGGLYTVVKVSGLHNPFHAESYQLTIEEVMAVLAESREKGYLVMPQ